MDEKLLSREEFLKSGFKKIGDFIDLFSKESHVPDSLPSYIRPPGSVKEASFIQLCDKCGVCADICPKKIIVLIDAGDELTRGTPIVAPGDDPCNFCLKCIDVCKTGALRQPEEKSNLKLGLAVISREICLSWDKGIFCNLCHYRCPQNAVKFKDNRFPMITPSKCNGCGSCQYICPTSPKAVKIVNV